MRFPTGILRYAMKKRSLVIAALVIAVLLVSIPSCSSLKVKRIDENENIDLSGSWNDTDIRQVCSSLIDSCLSGGWINSYILDKPAIRVGRIVNNSSEHIDTAIIAQKIEEALINSGKTKFLADSSTISQVRQEQADQQYFAADPVALAAETGADFLLQGSVRTNVDQIEGKTVRTYYVSLELVNVQTAEKAWVGNDTVKKYITRSKYSL